MKMARKSGRARLAFIVRVVLFLLATGADPADHGMIANIWFDRELGRVV